MKCHKLDGEITVLWVPSHCGCAGNEEADRLADEGTKLNQQEVPITHAIAQARVRKRKWTVEHDRAKEVFGAKRKPKWEVEKAWPRRVRSLYARLRSGHSKELREYRYKIDAEDDPYCDCREEETIQHILCDCPLLEMTRRSIMQEPVTLHHLVTEPDKCRRLLTTKIEELKLKHEVGVKENVRQQCHRGPDAAHA